MTGVLRRFDGGWFMWCPGCNDLHSVNDSWAFDGNEESPTFSPSILVQGNDWNGQSIYCHSFIRDGKWQFLSDSKHWAAGQTLPMEPQSEWPPIMDMEQE